MAVYLEKTVPDMPKIYVNGGSRGFLVGMEPRELVRVLSPVLVEVGIDA
jgi:prolyl-tRNA editing enzyme YbaK/EbsC (Cys-tRNA(Pro) deacylase)